MSGAALRERRRRRGAVRAEAAMNASGRLPAAGAEERAALALLPPGGNGSAGGGAAELRGGTHGATVAACGALLALAFCLGSYGNLIALLSCLDPALRRFRTNFDFMVLNLSFCDLFLCGVAAPMFAFVLFSDSARGVPGAFCFTFHLTSSGFIIMSLKTVAAIALHRLRMVLGRQPHRAASFPRTLLLTLLLWATSFALAALAALNTRRSRLCLPVSGMASREGKAALALYVADFIGCVAVVAVSYVVIARALRRNARSRRCPPARAPQPFAVPALYRNQARGVRLAPGKDRRAVGTCVAIVLSVLVCCLPLGITLVRDTLWGSGGFALYQFELCGFTLIFFKSGLNPFIYSRNSAGLRRRALWCLRHVALLCCCCKQKTRLRAVGKGSLEVNRNKSSHHETNSAYVLSPRPQRKLMDQACGPSRSRESALSPKASAGPQHHAQSSSTPMNTRLEPYYSIYNSSPSQEGSTPNSLQPMSSAFGFTKSYVAMHYRAGDRDCGGAAARHIPVPSV